MTTKTLKKPGNNGKDAVASVHDKIMTPGTKEHAAFTEKQRQVRIGIINVKSPRPQYLNVRAGGVTELVSHPFSRKAMIQMEEIQMREKTKVKEARKPKNPVEEMFWAFHWGMGIPKMVQTGEKTGYCVGIPTFKLTAIKSAIIDTLKMQQPELYKKDLQRILFLRGFEDLHHAPIEFNAKTGLNGRLDYVKLANGSHDIRYRPEFFPWAISFQVEYMPEYWSEQTILDAIQNAGYLNGIGEWRMERGGAWGRFAIDPKLTGKKDLLARIGKAKPQRINLAVTKIGE